MKWSSPVMRLVTAWFWALWRPHLSWMFWIVGGSFVSATLLAVFPYLWQLLIDAVRAGAEPPDLRDLAGWMALVGLAHPCFYLLLQGARTVMNARVEQGARERVFASLISKDDAYWRRWRVGDLVTRLTDDAGRKISWFLCSGCFRTLEASLIVAACLAGMASIDALLTLWCVLPLPLLAVFQWRIQNGLAPRFTKVQDSISAINDQLADTFSGIRIVQAAHLEDAARDRFAGAAGAQADAEVSAAVLEQLLTRMYGYSFQFAVVALMLAGGSRVIDGTLTVGQYVAFEGYILTLVWPMFDVGMFVSKLQQTAVALGRLQALVDAPQAQPECWSHTSTGLMAEGVTTVASDGVPLLRDVQLRVKPGQLMAVVGEVGSGKSVLLELLAGARALTAGHLSRPPRAEVAHVAQDPLLLSATVRENILLGRDVDASTLAEALEVSRLAQDLPTLAEGLQTPVGERGVTLSGGQQQRVALARALAGRPHVLLLDDATAALDADTESAFWAALERVLPEVAAVVVTHRLATLQRADEVVVLESGAVVQRGRHAELIGQQGPYRRIYGRYEAMSALS